MLLLLLLLLPFVSWGSWFCSFQLGRSLVSRSARSCSTGRWQRFQECRSFASRIARNSTVWYPILWGLSWGEPLARLEMMHRISKRKSNICSDLWLSCSYTCAEECLVRSPRRGCEVISKGNVRQQVLLKHLAFSRWAFDASSNSFYWFKLIVLFWFFLFNNLWSVHLINTSTWVN